jgi:hypothetical protein
MSVSVVSGLLRAASFAAALAMIGSVAHAAVVYDNGPPASDEGGWTSETGWGQVGGDFSLLGPGGAVNAARWWGGYCCWNTVPAADDFTLSIFAFVGGTPSSTPLYSLHVGNDVERTPTGVMELGIYPQFEYFAKLTPAIVLTPGTPYLFSIVNNQDPDPTTGPGVSLWRWTISTSEPGDTTWIRGEGTGMQWAMLGAYEMSFQLIRGVPSPGVLALLLAGLLPFLFLPRRIQQRSSTSGAQNVV